MPEIRAIISIVFRITFVTLIAVLMVLWIVMGVQAVNEIKQIESQKNNRNQNQFYDKRTLDRAKGMTIFNAIIDESIAILAIVGVVLNQRYLLQTSMILLSVIWLIAHSRMVELVAFFTPTMVAAHVILFIVVCIGLTYTHFVKETANSRRDKTSKIRDSTNGTNGTNGTTKA